MKEIRKFSTGDNRCLFDDWIYGLDVPVRARIRLYIDRVALGGGGRSVKHLVASGGVREIRIDSGPGYRIYFGETAGAIILLCGGVKGTQERDIRRAIEYWRTVCA